MSPSKSRKLTKIRNFSLSVEALIMLQTLGFIRKKKMNRVLNELIEEEFKREGEHPIGKTVKDELEKITKEFLEKSV